jgi:CBS domain-containing protein
MSITSIMKSDLVSVGPDETVAVAAARMAAHNLGALLVMDEGKLHGIFTERDLLTKVIAVGLDPKITGVRGVSTQSPVTVPSTATLADCYQILKTHNFRHLPVLGADGKPVGVVSSRDFLRVMVLGLEEHVDLMALCAQLANLNIDIYGD